MADLTKSALRPLVLAVLLIASPSWANDPVATHSGQSVPEVVDKISAKLGRRGFAIVATIDHARNAQSADLDLPPTTVNFARHRKLELGLIRTRQTVGIDLPRKILVWEDENGDIRSKSDGTRYLVLRHQPNPRTNGHFKGLVTIDSGQSVKATVADLRAALQGAGLPILLEIDYRADAKPAGKPPRPTTLIVFGNPQVDTPLMQDQQQSGINLPQKFLVWEDPAGDVHITWNDPFFIAQRAGITGRDDLLARIAVMLADLGGIRPKPLG